MKPRSAAGALAMMASIFSTGSSPANFEETPDRLDSQAEAIDMIKVLRDRMSQESINCDRMDRVSFEEIERALRGNRAKIKALQKMEATGGEPDVVALQEGSFLFADCSLESPQRRALTLDEAYKMADDFGVEMLDEVAYRGMQQLPLDKESWSWLQTPQHTRDNGFGVSGHYVTKDNKTRLTPSSHHSPKMGWRGMLKVPMK